MFIEMIEIIYQNYVFLILETFIWLIVKKILATPTPTLIIQYPKSMSHICCPN